MVESAAPVEHVFAVDELFFSTTDYHGRIRRANSTFMRLSGYPRAAPRCGPAPPGRRADNRTGA